MAEQIVLPERLDTVAAVALAKELSAKAADGQIVLNAGAVTHFGAQAAQVILSAAKTMTAAGGSIECTDIGERAQANLEAMGLSTSILTEAPQ